MNHALVVDASVTVKRLLLENFTDQARALFNDALQHHRPLLAPPHFLSEVTNALYQRVMQRRQPQCHLTEAEADLAVQAFFNLPIRLSNPAVLYPQAFAFAKAHNLPSIYDALYVVLAQLLTTELWTGDERLYNAIHTAAPWVRFIRDYPLSSPQP